jgi:hypothetical protein
MMEISFFFFSYLKTSDTLASIYSILSEGDFSSMPIQKIPF